MVTGKTLCPKSSLETLLFIAVFLLAVTSAIIHVRGVTLQSVNGSPKGPSPLDNSEYHNHQRLRDVSKRNDKKEANAEDLPRQGSVSYSINRLGRGRVQKRSTGSSLEIDERGANHPESPNEHDDSHNVNIPEMEDDLRSVSEDHATSQGHSKQEVVASSQIQALSPEENEIAQNRFLDDENKGTVSSSVPIRHTRQPHFLRHSNDDTLKTVEYWTRNSIQPGVPSSTSLWPTERTVPMHFYSGVPGYDPQRQIPYSVPLYGSSRSGEPAGFWVNHFNPQNPNWNFGSPVCRTGCITLTPIETAFHTHSDFDYDSYKDFDFTRIFTPSLTKLTHKEPVDNKQRLEVDSEYKVSSLIPKRTLDIYSSAFHSSMSPLDHSTLSSSPSRHHISPTDITTDDVNVLHTKDFSPTTNTDMLSLISFQPEMTKDIQSFEDLRSSITEAKILSDITKPTTVVSDEILPPSQDNTLNYTVINSRSLEGSLDQLTETLFGNVQGSLLFSPTEVIPTNEVIFGEMHPMDVTDMYNFTQVNTDSFVLLNPDQHTGISAASLGDVFSTISDSSITGNKTTGVLEDTIEYWLPADVMLNNTQQVEMPSDLNSSQESLLPSLSYTSPELPKLETVESSTSLSSNLVEAVGDVDNSIEVRLKKAFSPSVHQSSVYPELADEPPREAPTLAFTDSHPYDIPAKTSVIQGPTAVIPNSLPTPATDSTKEPPIDNEPNCNTVSVCIMMTVSLTWTEFCKRMEEFQKNISAFLSQYTKPIRPSQIVFSDLHHCLANGDNEVLIRRRRHKSITIRFFVTNQNGVYDDKMTKICGYILRKVEPAQDSFLYNMVSDVRLYQKDFESTVTENTSTTQTNTGIIAAVTISAIAGACLFLLCIMLVLMKQRLAQARHCNPSTDAYSLDSFSVSASFRRRRARQSLRSFINHGFDDPDLPSRPLNFAGLANRIVNRESLEEEFKVIPMNMPRVDQIPPGAEEKNRYANIIPIPETRVPLSSKTREPNSDYINANYVRGYGGKAHTYVACQAPLPETIEDFWRMIWEQQSRIIIMMTQLDENGLQRCAPYFPENTLDCHMLFGDYQVSLQKKDMREHYIMSTFRLYELEKNLFREVIHFWYTAWPHQGVPQDSGNLVNFLLHVRSYINSNSGPAIVHCSAGTGRTGVLIALDICMREYEESQSVDILRCVSRLRADRGGAVQTKDQYIFIHEAMHEYASRLANQSHRTSVKSNA